MVQNYDRTDVMPCYKKIVSGLDSCKLSSLCGCVRCVCYRSGHVDTSEDNPRVRKGEPALQCRRQICAPDSSSLKPGTGATEGVLDYGVLGCPAYYPWAGLMGCEDMKAEDYTWVRIGLSLAWKASLAAEYVDSFLCNRLCVTLDPPGVYINRRT